MQHIQYILVNNPNYIEWHKNEYNYILQYSDDYTLGLLWGNFYVFVIRCNHSIHFFCHFIISL